MPIDVAPFSLSKPYLILTTVTTPATSAATRMQCRVGAEHGGPCGRSLRARGLGSGMLPANPGSGEVGTLMLGNAAKFPVRCYTNTVRTAATTLRTSPSSESRRAHFSGAALGLEAGDPRGLHGEQLVCRGRQPPTEGAGVVTQPLNISTTNSSLRSFAPQ